MLILKSSRRMSLNAIAFSPDGTRLAAAGRERPDFLIWELPSGRLERLLEARSPWVRWLSFVGPDRLAIGGVGVELFALADGVRVAVTHSGAAAVAPDGRSLCLGSGATIERRPLTGDRPEAWQARLDGLSSYNRVTALAWSVGGGVIAAGLLRGEVLLLDAATGAEAARLAGPGGPPVQAVALSPAGDVAAWCSSATLHVGRAGAAGGARIRLGRTHFLGVAFHPAGTFLASANGDGKVDCWDAITAERRGSFDWAVGKLNAVAFDAAGDRAACCSERGEVVVWDVDH